MNESIYTSFIAEASHNVKLEHIKSKKSLSCSWQQFSVLCPFHARYHWHQLNVQKKKLWLGSDFGRDFLIYVSVCRWYDDHFWLSVTQMMTWRHKFILRVAPLSDTVGNLSHPTFINIAASMMPRCTSVNIDTTTLRRSTTVILVTIQTLATMSCRHGGDSQTLMSRVSVTVLTSVNINTATLLTPRRSSTVDIITFVTVAMTMCCRHGGNSQTLMSRVSATVLTSVNINTATLLTHRRSSTVDIITFVTVATTCCRRGSDSQTWVSLVSATIVDRVCRCHPVAAAPTDDRYRRLLRFRDDKMF